MDPSASNTILHFMHIHSLTKVYEVSDYLCDACMRHGIGTGFLCKPCDFILHDFCATCPETLSSFYHHHHVLTRHLHSPQIDKLCDLCSDVIEGIHYNCELCGFDAHPVCTQLSRDEHHNRDPIEAWFAATFGSITAKDWAFVGLVAVFSMLMAHVITQGGPRYNPVNFHHYHYYSYWNQCWLRNQDPMVVFLAVIFVGSFIITLYNIGLKNTKRR